MPSVPNISFSVRFDLTSIPTLVITDTSTNGLLSTRVASFDITQPDLYTREGNILLPDLDGGETSFSIPLRLDSLGLPQKGTYKIVMTVRDTGYDDTEFTREWISMYQPVNLVITENFDVFTPSLSVRDNTTYAVSNFNSGSLTRSWSITSVPTGTITGSGVTQSLAYNGSHYDANYTLSLTSSLLYTHQVYSWFTVQETINKTVNTYAQTPSDLLSIVSDISALKLSVDNAINSGNEFYQQKADFEYAQVLLLHIVDKIKVNDTNNIYKDLKDLIAVLNNYQIPAYTPTNQPIPPYDLTAYFPGAVWGSIAGTLSSQTDLWNVLQDLYTRDHYTHTQSIASTTWAITHNMGKKPSVSIVDTSDDEVIGMVHHNSINQLVITFSAAVSGKAYLN